MRRCAASRAPVAISQAQLAGCRPRTRPTTRAGRVELERARIASELHDVVTHNVSVMIVQAGAARQVLARPPGQARAALLAVEASGRAAMTELRHLLGLLSPAGRRIGRARRTADAGPAAAAGPGPAPVARRPGRRHRAARRAARRSDVPPELPPGLDLAAFRVVQEALTNVIKHAGKPRTSVSLDCRDGDLVVEVADVGPPIPAAAARRARRRPRPARPARAGGPVRRASWTPARGPAAAGRSGPASRSTRRPHPRARRPAARRPRTGARAGRRRRPRRRGHGQ